MAEHRPYRLPGSSADERWRRVKQNVLLWLGTALVAVNQMTTQHAAFVLRYAPWLGHSLFHLRGEAIYPPWAWIVWFVKWHWAPALEPLWRQCLLQVFLPMGFMSLVMCTALAMVRRDWFGDASDLHGSARWATTRDLRAARLLESHRSFARRAGVLLGRWRRQYLRDCGPAHVLVFAPTRSGKGVGVVIPTLLSWPHSVLVHDLKGENWALTAGARKRMGQICLRFAPASAEGDGARYNPLAEVRLRTPNEIRDVRNVVQMIIDPDGKGLPDHWSREGSAFLTGMILDQLYAGREKTLSGLEARLCDPSQPIDDTLAQMMRAEHDPEGAMAWTDQRGLPTRTHPIIARAMRSMLDKSPNERSGVISEVKGFLELYRDPVIAANSAVSDFRIVDLMNHARPVSLYIVVPLAHKNSLKPVIRLMLSQIVHRLTEHLEYRNGRAVTGYRQRLLLMIDEFPSLGRLDVFAESLALVAGYGIKACLIAQDLSQIHAAYGHDEAITSNCHTRVAFTPNRIETARLLSQMTGEATVRHAHRTVSSSGASVSEPEVARPLITPDEVMRLGSSEALIFTSGRPTIRARKLRYYNELGFVQAAAIPPPSSSDRIEQSDAAVIETASPQAPPEVCVKVSEADAEIAAEPPSAGRRAAAKIRAAKSAGDPRQLSFLRSVLEQEDGAPTTPQQQERLL
jgi:type IV secretion system protein VirD4